VFNLTKSFVRNALVENTLDDCIAYLNQVDFADRAKELKIIQKQFKYDFLWHVNQIEDAFAFLGSIEDRKRFARKVIELYNDYSQYLFLKRDNKDYYKLLKKNIANNTELDYIENEQI
jgi:hypothetical protein